jgi:hypothetical protein
MLKTYGFGSSASPMTCYTKEAGANYAPMLTVTVMAAYPIERLLHDGDANNDGLVDVVDLAILAKNYDWSGAPQLPAPEPTTLSLLALSGLAIMRRAKKV